MRVWALESNKPVFQFNPYLDFQPGNPPESWCHGLLG